VCQPWLRLSETAVTTGTELDFVSACALA